MDFADNVGFIDDEHKIQIKDMGITPVVAAMIDVLMIPAILDRHFGSLDPRKKIDVGLASKALIIDILRGRSPLLRVMNGFQSLDCGVLLGEGLVPADINDDCLGDALEVLGKNDCRALYSEICLRALKLHGCSLETAHIDTTNFTVYGEYGEDNPKDFEITYTKPKKQAYGSQTVRYRPFCTGKRSSVRWPVAFGQ